MSLLERIHLRPPPAPLVQHVGPDFVIDCQAINR